MRAGVAEAIELLYRAFGRYTPATLNQSCGHCVFPSQVQALQTGELRKLSAEDLSYYSFKAMTTFGKAEDFKYFLPRLCEVIADESFPKNVEIVLGGKLRMAEFQDWPDEERGAVVGFLLALWRDTLQQWPSHLSVDELLHSLASTSIRMDVPLGIWAELIATHADARLHLANWMCWGHGLQEMPLTFWDEIDAQWAEFASWVKAPTTAPLVEAAFADWLSTAQTAAIRSSRSPSGAS